MTTTITLTVVPTTAMWARSEYLLTLRRAISRHLGVPVQHADTWPTPRLTVHADEAETTAAAALYLDGAGVQWEVTD